MVDDTSTNVNTSRPEPTWKPTAPVKDLENVNHSSIESNSPSIPAVSIESNNITIDCSKSSFHHHRSKSPPDHNTTDPSSEYLSPVYKSDIRLPSRPRTDSISTTVTVATLNSTHCSPVFVTSVLETIASSKDAHKNKALGEATRTALTALSLTDDSSSVDPNILFEPLRLAASSHSVQIVTAAIDCIGKLISFSVFSAPPQATSEQSIIEPSLIERSIDTICGSFQNETTSTEIQLQIVKSLLAAVLNDRFIVHGSGLLKAIRLIYNIILLSRSNEIQSVAQGALTQMVNMVFERVRTNLTLRSSYTTPSILSGPKDDSLDSNVNSDDSTKQSRPSESCSDSLAANDSTAFTTDTVKRTSESTTTLQTFDDGQIHDNAPTLVTRVSPKSLGIGRRSSRSSHQPGDGETVKSPDNESDIFIRDAYLVFRAMCRLSTKSVPPDQTYDLKSPIMRSKLLSLHVIHFILYNHVATLTSPMARIRSSADDEPTSFIQAIKQHLCLSLSRNAACTVGRIFEVSCEIFWLVLTHLRDVLKKEIAVFMKEVYFSILEKRAAPTSQKLYVLRIFERLAVNPRALVEIYLNYDCDRTALDNLFQRIIEHLSRISSINVQATPAQQHAYQDARSKDNFNSGHWQNMECLPPFLMIWTSGQAELDQSLNFEYSLKEDSLYILVKILKSLIAWGQANSQTGGTTGEHHEDFNGSVEGLAFSSVSVGGVNGDPGCRGTASGGWSIAEDDPSHLEQEKLRKTALDNAIRLFNFKPHRGLKALVEEGFIQSRSAGEIAKFLHENLESLNKATLGEFLGEGDPESIIVMHSFVDMMDFRQTRFVDALRHFLQSFRLPGEAQKIDRFMLKFAERYMAGNPTAFANADTAYVLAYSVIMLNTDQHSSKVRGRRMTYKDFIKNNRGINDNNDLPDDYLRGIFEEIASHEIVLDTERETAINLGQISMHSKGLAATIGESLAGSGRDWQREIYCQTSEEISNRTEHMYKRLVRAEKRNFSKLAGSDGGGNGNIEVSGNRFIPATSSKHVGPMFQNTWMSFLTALAAHTQNSVELQSVRLSLEGQRLAIRIACMFDLDDPKQAFVSSISKSTQLYNLSEMTGKSIEALKVLLEIGYQEGNYLKDSWREILTNISQLDRLQLISTGVDERNVPDVTKMNAKMMMVMMDSDRRQSKAKNEKVGNRTRDMSVHSGSTGSGGGSRNLSIPYQREVGEKSRSVEIVRSVDRIFTNSANLTGDAVVYFVKNLCQVSWQEILSSGECDSPRTYSLQKIVEVSEYNMVRVRFEWKNIWTVLGEHFNQVGCSTHGPIISFALDSLRQLSMRFLEIEELARFKFQKQFLEPFKHIMMNTNSLQVKDMILRCLTQMIQVRGENIRSGWRSMFEVFSLAAQGTNESLYSMAYDNVMKIYRERFSVVVAQGSFSDLMYCLTQFSKNMKFQRKSLKAIEIIDASFGEVLNLREKATKTAEPIATTVDTTTNGSWEGQTGCDATMDIISPTDKCTAVKSDTKVNLNSSCTTTTGTTLWDIHTSDLHRQFWLPIFFSFHDIIMTGEDLEVRSRALKYLFDSLICYGTSFNLEFWDTLWKKLLYPIFMVLKSKSEMSKVVNNEDFSVWLSTTMIQALRKLIHLFTHFFHSLEFMLDRFLDLLALCVCQENDTLARIGSNCLQQLIVKNVNKFNQSHWHKIVDAFVKLFARTEAAALFSASTLPPPPSQGQDRSRSQSHSSSLHRSPSSSQISASMILNDENHSPLSPVHSLESSPETSAISRPGKTSPSLELISRPTSSSSTGENPNQLDSRTAVETVTDQSSVCSPPNQVTSLPGNSLGYDYENCRSDNETQKVTPVVTSARRRFFNQIITKCVLQLLMIETVHDLFTNDEVYTCIPSSELLRLMVLLKKSYLFARRFNEDWNLRDRLFREGFMKQPPNLLKQESGSASVYVSILFRMYLDQGEERTANRQQTERALLPLCLDIIKGFLQLDPESQRRNIATWRPVVVDVLEGYAAFPQPEFIQHSEIFAPLILQLLSKELTPELQRALCTVTARIFHLIVPQQNPSSRLISPSSHE